IGVDTDCTRLPVRADYPILGEPERIVVRSRYVVAGTQAEASVQVGGSILAAEVAAPDVEESARREFEPLLRLPSRPLHQHLRRLESPAIAESRGRRLLHRDQHVGCGAAVRQFLDANAPE